MADRASLDKARMEAAVGNRVLTELGLSAGIRASLGHVSMRVPGDPEKFVVKGRGYRMDVISRMRPEDLVVCDLEGNFVDGPAYTSQCSEVKIHSCIMRERPDVVSVTHVHPDFTVLMSVLGGELKPMAQEGAALVSKPIPMMNMMKIVQTEEEGAEVARLLGDGDIVLLKGHGAVTVSTRSVQHCVMNMAQLEHQARLNYLATCAAGGNHPSIPLELALQPQHPLPPHLAARVANIEGERQGGEGIWGYFRELVTADM